MTDALHSRLNEWWTTPFLDGGIGQMEQDIEMFTIQENLVPVWWI